MRPKFAVANPDAVLEAIEGALRDYSMSADAMRWTPEPETADAEDVIWFELNRVVNMEAVAEFGRQISAMFSQMAASAGQMSVPLLKMAGEIAHAADVQERPRWHRRRCPRCNPRGFTTASWSYGHEYRRRLKARARRRCRH